MADIIKLWTKKGLEKQNNCLLNGNKFGVKYLAIGDGNGSIPIPTEEDTKLVNEVWRSEISNIEQKEQKFTVTAYIPESAGDFIIREMGIFDENNELLFIAQMDETPKKASSTGLIKQIGIQGSFELKNGISAVIVDPNIITASKDFVSENYQKISEKGIANGYACLDKYGKVPEEQLPKNYSGLEVCDIGMALYVDETKGLRRYLNGQIVDINANTQAFLDRLKQITTLHPSLLCTEDEWQTAKTMSAFGQVGKFVFNYSGDEVVSVRIPAIVNVQGLFDLQNLGLMVAESLPNHTHTNSITLNRVWGNGTNRDYGACWSGDDCLRDTQTITTTTSNASSSIYKDNAHVQQEAIQYPYFIQIATGSETENNIINEIELNNPYSLFDSKYSDHELNNLSWLKSEGQWNAKAVYPTAYDKLLKVYNGAETVEGLSVKLSTEEYTDYDYVLNTAEETFRLPLLDGSEDLPSDRYIDLELLASGSTYEVPANGYVNIREKSTTSPAEILIDAPSLMAHDYVTASNAYLTCSAPIKRGETFAVGYYNITSDSNTFFKFYYAKGNGSLYYYVGETVQNANLIDASRIGEQLANKADINTPSIQAPYLKTTYINDTSGYNIWSNGYCEQWGLGKGSISYTASNTVTLLKPYRDTGYSLSVAFHAQTNVLGIARPTGLRSVNAFGVCTGYGGDTFISYPFFWKTCGYLAEGEY